MFLDVVSAANRRCRLQNLTELALTGGGWFSTCSECDQYPNPEIRPVALREAIRMLLPLPKLKVLRLTVAPSFLDIPDLELYQSIADRMPALQKLQLWHRCFATSSEIDGTTFHEKISLRHLAAFCHMLPNLVEVKVGTVDTSILEDHPRVEWASPGVTSLVVECWATPSRIKVLRTKLHHNLQSYFPCSDLVHQGVEPRHYMFEE